MTRRRLPRSAHSASGSPQPIWATATTNVTAPSEASWMWNDFSRSGPSTLRPAPMVLGTNAAAVITASGAKPDRAEDAQQRRRLAVARSGDELDVGYCLDIAVLGDGLVQKLVREP